MVIVHNTSFILVTNLIPVYYHEFIVYIIFIILYILIDVTYNFIVLNYLDILKL